MNKKINQKANIDKSKKKAKIKLVCPNCYKNMKPKKLDDGYVACAYCGLVVFKQAYSLEPIDAPGIIKVPNQKFFKKNNNPNFKELNNKCME